MLVDIASSFYKAHIIEVHDSPSKTLAEWMAASELSTTVITKASRVHTSITSKAANSFMECLFTVLMMGAHCYLRVILPNNYDMTTIFDLLFIKIALPHWVFNPRSRMDIDNYLAKHAFAGLWDPASRTEIQSLSLQEMNVNYLKRNCSGGRWAAAPNAITNAISTLFGTEGDAEYVGWADCYGPIEVPLNVALDVLPLSRSDRYTSLCGGDRYAPNMTQMEKLSALNTELIKNTAFRILGSTRRLDEIVRIWISEFCNRMDAVRDMYRVLDMVMDKISLISVCYPYTESYVIDYAARDIPIDLPVVGTMSAVQLIRWDDMNVFKLDLKTLMGGYAIHRSFDQLAWGCHYVQNYLPIEARNYMTRREKKMMMISFVEEGYLRGKLDEVIDTRLDLAIKPLAPVESIPYYLRRRHELVTNFVESLGPYVGYVSHFYATPFTYRSMDNRNYNHVYSVDLQQFSQHRVYDLEDIQRDNKYIVMHEVLGQMRLQKSVRFNIPIKVEMTYVTEESWVPSKPFEWESGYNGRLNIKKLKIYAAEGDNHGLYLHHYVQLDEPRFSVEFNNFPQREITVNGITAYHTRLPVYSKYYSIFNISDITYMSRTN
jgi:hypothetical protein